MYFMALAVDYDGTLASNGKVRAETIESLIKLKGSGRKLIMVTGRELDELKDIFNRLDLFDLVVAENGALIYSPQTESKLLISPAPPQEFIDKIKEKIPKPLSIGEVIIATFEPNEKIALDLIKEMQLDLDIIFNKGAVMILPSGVNKATGLQEALKELGLSLHNIIGIGDAENDLAFLRTVGLSIAVANACESVKDSACLVTKKARGEGVEELIEELVQDEYELVNCLSSKIALGVDSEGNAIKLNPLDHVLIAGNSGIGKSTLATALTEKMVENDLQFCIFDPEGDYDKLDNAFSVGEIKIPPSQEQVIELLKDSQHNVVVNTLGIDLKDRPSFFVQLAPKLITLKGSFGRPHWLIIDEAHHLIPADHRNSSIALPKEGIIMITVHPKEIEVSALKTLDVIITLGPQAAEILKEVSRLIGEALPANELPHPSDKEVLVWQRQPIQKITIVTPDKPKQEHKRHNRKYAEGDLSEEYCFYFKGPHNALNLRVQNLMIFLQIAEGIDEDTWMHHLKNNDYSDWFRDHIKDKILAEAALKIENDPKLSSEESRQAIAKLVKELYTAPASASD